MIAPREILVFKVAGAEPPRAKNHGDLLPLLACVGQRAAEEVRAAFPGHLKRYAIPTFPECNLSKARHGSACNPARRFGLLIVALWWGGAPRERAQRLVDAAQDLVNLLWPVEPPAEERAPVLVTLLSEARAERDRLNRTIPLLERELLRVA